MLKKIILLLIVIWPLTALAAGEQSMGLIFTGKIEEISSRTDMMPNIGAREKFLIIKLDSKPKTEFRITAKNAARFGLIDNEEPGAVITPGKIKGLGWKVRLTCDKKGTFGEPYYLVSNLEKLD